MSDDLDRYIGEIGANDRSSTKSGFKRDSIVPEKYQDYSLVRMSDVEPEPADFLWYPYIRRYTLNDERGDAGIGKSSLTFAVVSALTNGKQPSNMPGKLNISRPTNVIYLCNEDDNPLYSAMLQAQGANRDYVFMPQKNVPDLSNLDAIEWMIQAYDAELLVFDPITRFLPENFKNNASVPVRRLMEELREMCKRNKCTVLMLEHLNKDSKKSNEYRGNGSQEFFNAARSVLMVGFTQDGMHACGHLKSNAAPKGETILYDIEEYFVDGFENSVGRIVWKGCDESIDGSDVIPNQPKFTRRRKAIEARTANYMQLLSALVGTTFWEGRTAEAIEKAKSLGISGDFTAEGLGRYLSTTKLTGIRIASKRHTSSGTRYRLERDSND